MERRSLALLSAAMGSMGLAASNAATEIEILDDEIDRYSIRDAVAYPESYRDDNYSGRRNPRNGGKSYAITADPTRAKVKAARKQSMKNRKKK